MSRVRRPVSNIAERASTTWRLCCLLCGRTQEVVRLVPRRECATCGGFLEALRYSEWERQAH
jgi:rRNA maturation endonuclease Nob1